MGEPTTAFFVRVQRVNSFYYLLQTFNDRFCDIYHYIFLNGGSHASNTLHVLMGVSVLICTSKEPVCPRVELILKIIIILLIIFLGFIKSKPC